MLYDESAIQDHLRRIVRSVTTDLSWQDDLLQEALLHLRKKESETPGQTPSWYLQSCRGHIRDFLRHGVSLDSQKHAPFASAVTDELSDSEPLPDSLILHEEISSSTCAHDILERLSSSLDSLSCAILRFLSEGLNEREVAEKLGLSRPAVRKRRIKIAAQAVALGILPHTELSL